jgi:hypothetical protein
MCVNTKILHDLNAALKESAAKGDTTRITITEPPSNEEFREQIRRKWHRQKSQEASYINNVSKWPRVMV